MILADSVPCRYRRRTGEDALGFCRGRHCVLRSAESGGRYLPTRAPVSRLRERRDPNSSRLFRPAYGRLGQ